MPLSDRSLEGLHHFLDDVSILNASFKCLSVAGDNSVAGEQRGMKRRKTDSSGATKDGRAHVQVTPENPSRSLARTAPSSRALRFLAY